VERDEQPQVLPPGEEPGVEGPAHPGDDRDPEELHGRPVELGRQVHQAEEGAAHDHRGAEPPHAVELEEDEAPEEDLLGEPRPQRLAHQVERLPQRVGVEPTGGHGEDERHREAGDQPPDEPGPDW